MQQVSAPMMRYSSWIGCIDAYLSPITGGPLDWEVRGMMLGNEVFAGEPFQGAMRKALVELWETMKLLIETMRDSSASILVELTKELVWHCPALCTSMTFDTRAGEVYLIS